MSAMLIYTTRWHNVVPTAFRKYCFFFFYFSAQWARIGILCHKIVFWSENVRVCVCVLKEFISCSIKNYVFVKLIL
jgi:hypothetical protein